MNKEKLAEILFDIPYQDLSDYQVDKVEDVEKLLVEAKIEALNCLYGSTLLDTQVLAADMGENELQSYMAGYKTGWREASQLIEDHVTELQQSLKDKS